MREMHSIQAQREAETLENIKQKVDRIKATQHKFEPILVAAKTHHEGNLPIFDGNAMLFTNSIT